MDGHGRVPKEKSQYGDSAVLDAPIRSKELRFFLFSAETDVSTSFEKANTLFRREGGGEDRDNLVGLYYSCM